MRKLSSILTILSLLLINFNIGLVQCSPNKPLNSFLRQMLEDPDVKKSYSNNPSYDSSPIIIWERQAEFKQLLISFIDKTLALGFFLLNIKLAVKSINTLVESIASKLSKKPTDLPLPVNVTNFLQPNVTLNSYEEDLLNSFIDPKTIEVDWNDIGGLKEVKKSLEDMIYMENLLKSHSTSRNSLYQPVRSLLLYGPPGCGKSMLVKCVAKKMNLPLISISPSSLLRMYVGETSQLTKAVFTLIKKLQPSILFIDEMDSLFRSRQAFDHSVDRNVNTEFMQLWDDLTTTDSNVIVVGATNRPQDLDPAIQRRFDVSHLVTFPDLNERVDVFKRVLKGINKESKFDYEHCARATEGYSPSDIHRVCRTAVMFPLREAQKPPKTNSKTPNSTVGSLKPRPLGIADVEQALLTVFPTSWAASSFGTFGTSPPGNPPSPATGETPFYSPNGPPAGGKGWGAAPGDSPWSWSGDERDGLSPEDDDFYDDDDDDLD